MTRRAGGGEGDPHEAEEVHALGVGGPGHGRVPSADGAVQALPLARPDPLRALRAGAARAGGRRRRAPLPARRRRGCSQPGGAQGRCDGWFQFRALRCGSCARWRLRGGAGAGAGPLLRARRQCVMEPLSSLEAAGLGGRAGPEAEVP
ncbi:unnamed protein product, partial [Prorocentrum cordatum]